MFRGLNTITCPYGVQLLVAVRRCRDPHNRFLLELFLEAHVLHKTLIALVAAVALGCVPMTTTAFAAGHGHGGGHAGGHAGGHGGGHAGYARAGGYAHGGRYARGGGGGYYVGGGPIYDSCAGYGYGPGYGCPGYGVPLVGGVINGILGGYGPF